MRRDPFSRPCDFRFSDMAQSVTFVALKYSQKLISGRSRARRGRKRTNIPLVRARFRDARYRKSRKHQTHINVMVFQDFWEQKSLKSGNVDFGYLLKQKWMSLRAIFAKSRFSCFKTCKNISETCSFPLPAR